MFNTNNIAMGLLLARNSEKMLKNKQANLPKNWNLRQGLLMSLFPNPTVGMVLHQNEVSKEDQKITNVSRAKLTEASRVLNEVLQDPQILQPVKDKYIGKLVALKPSIPVLNPVIQTPNATLDLQKKQIAVMEGLLEELKKGKVQTNDDLTKLTHVGTAKAKVLKKFGISSFDDVKKWDKASFVTIFKGNKELGLSEQQMTDIYDEVAKM